MGDRTLYNFIKVLRFACISVRMKVLSFRNYSNIHYKTNNSWFHQLPSLSPLKNPGEDYSNLIKWMIFRGSFYIL